ncbi:MAG TPA: 16S rRNA (cytosine(1402)-N(4))-methyltransferase RsmH [Firmicutes bacterium]|nr:16S rRNA (cytosine(1402)-N(4))-methyltransferase RsmH [Bacillota bacterium]
MVEEAMHYLAPRDGGLYFDCTAGAGGHSKEILRRSAPNGKVVCIDTDPCAIEVLRSALGEFGERAVVVQANFTELAQVADRLGISQTDGILFDLGVSSLQLDLRERGFSYSMDAPLDMRMNPQQVLTARTLVNELDEAELARIFCEYGEERWGGRIARFIVERRARKTIETTGELVDVIKAAIPASARRKGPHPAKRVFQALRIAVNGELEALRQVLPVATSILNCGGRIVVISFHSLEDRIVKDWFKNCAELCVLTKKPIRPAADEITANPRCRSAKLRAAERVLAVVEGE